MLNSKSVISKSLKEIIDRYLLRGKINHSRRIDEKNRYFNNCSYVVSCTIKG